MSHINNDLRINTSDIIDRAISLGVIFYNTGNFKECALVYSATINTLNKMGVLSKSTDQIDINYIINQTMLSFEASSSKDDKTAWVYRIILDNIREGYDLTISRTQETLFNNNTEDAFDNKLKNLKQNISNQKIEKPKENLFDNLKQKLNQRGYKNIVFIERNSPDIVDSKNVNYGYDQNRTETVTKGSYKLNSNRGFFNLQFEFIDIVDDISASGDSSEIKFIIIN